MELKRYKIMLVRKFYYEVEEETLDQRTAEDNAIERVEDGEIGPLNPNVEADVVKVELVK